jgi:hypothetical protein
LFLRGSAALATRADEPDDVMRRLYKIMQIIQPRQDRIAVIQEKLARLQTTA